MMLICILDSASLVCTLVARVHFSMVDIDIKISLSQESWDAAAKVYSGAGYPASETIEEMFSSIYGETR